MVGRAPSGMGISTKSETRCRNFTNLSIFKNAIFETREMWQRVSLGKCPYPMMLARPQGAPRGFRSVEQLNNVPGRTDSLYTGGRVFLLQRGKEISGTVWVYSSTLLHVEY